MVTCAITLCAANSAAQSARDRTMAETLFRQARELMQQKQYEKACPKLAESQRLDPGGGTLLNLALCHELEGKTATAWAEFREGLALARSDRRPDRISFAEEHIAALEPKLARVTVLVPKEARVEGLELSLDGSPLREPLWESPLPVDPGERILEAKAPGHEPWRTSLEVEPAAQLEAKVPALKESSGSTTATGAGSASSGADVAADTGSGYQSTLGYGIAGIGLAAMAVGGYFGYTAMQKRADSDDECPGGRCTAEGVRLNDSALRSANYANIGFGVGLLAVGIGGYLVLTADDDEGKAATATQLRVGGVALPGHAELDVQARF